MTDRRGRVYAVLDLERHRCRRLRSLRPNHFCAHVKANQIEKVLTGIQCLTDQQLKRPLGRFQLIAVELHVFDLLQKFAPRIVAQTLLKPVLLQFVKDIPTPGKIAQQYALPVPDLFRLDVLVGRRVFQHRAHVYTALVGECAVAHIWLISAHLQVGKFGYKSRNRSKAGELLSPDGLMAIF